MSHMSHPAIATADLAELARRGLTHAEIAARVGLTRQGVDYRLKSVGQRASRRAVQPASLPPVWHPRPFVLPPASCAPCGRYLGPRAGKLGPSSLLADGCCRWCSRPLTDEARARQPLAGYVALACAMARQPASVRSHRVAEVDA